MGWYNIHFAVGLGGFRVGVWFGVDFGFGRVLLGVADSSMTCSSGPVGLAVDLGWLFGCVRCWLYVAFV